MNRPLYKEAQDASKKPSSHAGLWFDRFFDQYDDNWKVKDKENDNGKIKWINGAAGTAGDSAMLTSYNSRQQELVACLQGKALVMATDWHFVTGMGNNHPVENGFAWHPILGVPYLTGAAVKGLLRGWCEQWTEMGKEEIRLWFGPSLDELKKGADHAAGHLIFFDAVPTRAVTLKADIMTPHYKDWYAKGNEKPKPDGSNVPADWHDPIPVPFLVVDKGASFRFCIAKRATEGAQGINLAGVMNELKEALKWLGAGAKTAAGYGRMVEDSVSKQHREFVERDQKKAEAERQRREEDARRQQEAERAAREQEEQRQQTLEAMPEHERVLAEAADTMAELAPRLAMDNNAYGELRSVVNSVIDSASGWGGGERSGAVEWIVEVLDQHGWRHPDFNAKKKKSWEKKIKEKLSALKEMQ